MENRFRLGYKLLKMITIRPTQSLAKRMKVKLAPNETRSTARLGDWYAVDFVLNRRQLIMAVSSQSRLGVILDAAPYSTFPSRLPSAVVEVSQSIGVPSSKIEAEVAQMNEFTLAKTSDRSIIGTLVDYRKHLEYMAQADRLHLNNTLSMSLWISQTPSLVMDAVFPVEAVLDLFGEPPIKKRILTGLEFLKPKAGLYLVPPVDEIDRE